MRDRAGVSRNAASGVEGPCTVWKAEPHNHVAHAQDGKHGFARQRQVDLHTIACRKCSCPEWLPLLL